jgi:hypothetical protein
MPAVTRGHKKQAVEPPKSQPSLLTNVDLFTNIDVVRTVHSFMGARSWAQLAPVCKAWHAIYSAYITGNSADHKTHRDCCHDVDCTTLTSYATAFASMPLLQEAVKCGLKLQSDPAVQYNAGQHASTTVLKSARKNRMLAWTEAVSDGAARSGVVSKLKWLLKQQGCPTRTYTLLQHAATGGSIPTLRWLKQQPRVYFDKHTARCAARAGNLDALKYLLIENCPIDQWAAHAAAEEGHLDTLRFLHERNCPYYKEDIGLWAALGGSVPVLQWLAELLAERYWSAATWQGMLNNAGTRGHLAAAKWLREHGAEWPKALGYWTQPWPAPVLAWAREQGCTALHIKECS